LALRFSYFQLHKKGPPSAAEKEEAERLKTEGNNLMRTEKFDEALKMYSKVIYFIAKSQRAVFVNKSSAIFFVFMLITHFCR
jgi:hypothetical protein